MREDVIEQGITYLTSSEEMRYIKADLFYTTYEEDLNDAKEDVLAIHDCIKQRWSHYEEALGSIDLESYPALKTRLEVLQPSLADYETATNHLVGILENYVDVSKMIATLEDDGGDPHYIAHRKGELVSQNDAFNRIFDKLDYYIDGMDRAITYEMNLLHQMNEGASDSEENQMHVLSTYQSLLQRCFETNKALMDRLLFITPIVEHLREDAMTLKVAKAEEDVQRRRMELQARRENQVVADVRDYEDLEGQYRHRYNEDGELIETVESEEVGSGSAIQAVFVILALIAIVAGAYAYLR